MWIPGGFTFIHHRQESHVMEPSQTPVPASGGGGFSGREYRRLAVFFATVRYFFICCALKI